MAQDQWVTVPLDQLVRHEDHPDGTTFPRCTACNLRVLGDEVQRDEQIRMHLQRRHLAVLETSTGRLPARARARLIALGWTPPADEDTPGPPGGGSSMAKPVQQPPA